jgi:hypothetical protein
MRLPKVRENDGVQLGFRFKSVVVLPRPVFSLFSLFSSIWAPGAPRGGKKAPKKCPRALIHALLAPPLPPRLPEPERPALSGILLAVGHSAQNVTNCLKISTTSHPRAWLCFWLVGYAISISLYAQYVKQYHTKKRDGPSSVF